MHAARIGMIGFSAGDMTTMNVATSYDAAGRPDFTGVIYGAAPERSMPQDAPLAFIAPAADDACWATPACRSSRIGVRRASPPTFVFTRPGPWVRHAPHGYDVGSMAQAFRPVDADYTAAAAVSTTMPRCPLPLRGFAREALVSYRRVMSSRLAVQSASRSPSAERRPTRHEVSRLFQQHQCDASCGTSTQPARRKRARKLSGLIGGDR